MRCRRPLVILLAIFMLTGVFSVPAKAERFADLYLGLSHTQDDELKSTIGSASQTNDISFDLSVMIGYRMGYFFERAPFVGLALEGSYTELEYAGSEDITLLALSPLLMLRIPIHKTDEYPRGEWFPYVGIAPGIYKTRIDNAGITGDSVDIGWDLRTGVKKMVAPNWAIGLEYRYMGFSPEFEDDVAGDSAKAETDLNIHSLLFGVTYNF